jgi:hypothetical protein
MDFGRITDPNAWKQAMAGLLRRGGEVTDYIATAPEKAGQAILEGHERNKALQAQAFANPNRPFQVTNQQAMTELGDRMLAGPLSVAPVGMIAYHGTPHLIKDKFDISKVGTGEGAQAYGHGMYFAENPAVAKQYADELGATIGVNGKPLFDKGKIVGTTGNKEIDDYLVANLGNVDLAKNNILNDIREVKATNPDAVKHYKNLLIDLDKHKILNEQKGNLYKVDIPDEFIPKMIDWDKPLKQQPKDIQEWFEKINPSGAKYKNTGQFLRPYLQDKKYVPELEQMGYKGIRYLDNTSRDAGKGTSNFVVFDPSDVKLLERNNQPISRKELLQQQIDKIE